MPKHYNKKRIVWSIILGVGALIVFYIIANFIFPVDEETNTILTPSWYTILMVFLPGVIVLLNIFRPWKSLITSQNNTKGEFTMEQKQENAQIQDPNQAPKPRKPLYKRWWFWVIIGAASTALLASMANVTPKGGAPSEGGSTANTQTEEAQNNEQQPTNTSDEVADSAFINLNFDTSDYVAVDAELLYEYGDYLNGEKVVTVITVANSQRSSLKANTANGKSTVYSISCNFSSSDVNKDIKKDNVVTVAGTVNMEGSIFSTVTLDNCVIVGYGEISDTLSASKDDQVAYCEGKKQVVEEALAAALKAERDEYAVACETVDYKDVERNPDNYKGKKIKISGTVIQVSEGWLDSVTLRIEENDDNVWYVTYTRKEGESRILEDDYITCYGECDGVTSYTTILGTQVTIPSLKMAYYE